MYINCNIKIYLYICSINAVVCKDPTIGRHCPKVAVVESSAIYLIPIIKDVCKHFKRLNLNY